jgi:N-terminal domain of toast_rack, DUF2154
MSKIFVRALILVFILSACGTGWTQIDPKTEAIAIDYPGNSPTSLKLEVGLGNLTVDAGGQTLVQGTIIYNVKEWAPQTVVDRGSVTLRQGPTSGLGNLSGLNNPQNDWTLSLGTAKPYDLTITNGVARADLALGGLPLTALSVEGGVGSIAIRFDQPNPQVAERLSLRTGAGELKASGLLNLNVRAMTAESGAGSLQLDFTGDALKQDLTVHLTSGVGSVTANFKKGVPVRVVAKQGLGRVRGQGGDFTLLSDDIYATAGFDSAAVPKITITAETGVGELRLNTITSPQ